ncbi:MULTISPECIES: transposase [unclassified Ruminococcus]|uniref:RNA-guided endonuclease InsQ/TnpB family protein n=1 Tax=unclassified Ruminococcus TaxID=2608920 RepID=UPI00319E1D19
MYRVSKTLISKKRYPELHAYFNGYALLARNLYNAALFRLRQTFTMKGKDRLSANEQQVLDEIRLTMEVKKLRKPGRYLTYSFLEKMMRAAGNPDFFAGLPMQSAQEVLKAAIRSMKSWKEACQGYRADPSAYLGKPKMPKYKKPGIPVSLTYTNQDCIIYHRADGTSYLKLPKTSLTMEVRNIPDGGILKEVKAVPYHGDFLVICTFACPDTSAPDAPHACGIDLGVDNTAALVSSNEYCLLYKGGDVKAMNQWYNKQMAALRSIAMKGHSPEEAAKLGLLYTKQMDALARKRDLFLKDHLHKVSADIVRFCLDHGIGTIVIGVNKNWKQGCNIGHVNNQNFVQIPLATLRSMLRCKAEQEGLTVLEQEESFTSKADLTAMDEIPVYKKDHPQYRFSGKRTSRGLYCTHNGQVINADLNGAGNILRKAFPDIFKGADFSFLQDILVRNYRDLNKRIPVKGIGAA